VRNTGGERREKEEHTSIRVQPDMSGCRPAEKEKATIKGEQVEFFWKELFAKKTLCKIRGTL